MLKTFINRPSPTRRAWPGVPALNLGCSPSVDRITRKSSCDTGLVSELLQLRREERILTGALSSGLMKVGRKTRHTDARNCPCSSHEEKPAGKLFLVH